MEMEGNQGGREGNAVQTCGYSAAAGQQDNCPALALTHPGNVRPLCGEQEAAGACSCCLQQGRQTLAQGGLGRCAHGGWGVKRGVEILCLTQNN